MTVSPCPPGTDGELLVLCHLGLELRCSSVFSINFGPKKGRQVVFLLNNSFFFGDGDDQFFFLGACRLLKRNLIGFGCFCSFVSFPPTPPKNKIKQPLSHVRCGFISLFFGVFWVAVSFLVRRWASGQVANWKVFMNMLLINLLIAIILDTYKEVQRAEESGEAVS